ncbi:MAG TPA: glycosyltransferase family 4 protein [Stenotrophomonas sp.]
MSESRRRGVKGLVLLNIAAWAQRQSWLGAIYRNFPLGWRLGAMGMLSARANSGVRFVRTPAWKCSASTFLEQTSSDTIGGKSIPRTGSRPCVNIVGYIRGQFGLGESARLYAMALIEAGVEVRLYDIDLELPHGWNDHSLDAWIGEDLPHPISIIFVNPDFLEPALAKIGRDRLDGKYLIACWFWELDRIPDAWLPAIAQVDEIMVATKFVQAAFQKVTNKPVVHVPQPLSLQPGSKLQRADFSLEEGKFIFLVTFDFHSWVARKNPYAAIEAFTQAFGSERDDVRLLIKSSNGYRHPEHFRKLLNVAARDARIVVRDDVIDKAHVVALQRCCDAYVSLHRAEGFGLGLAECMAMGKPVIGTAWSGNMDFMTERNSCLVGYHLVPVTEGDYPGAEKAEWANANVCQAAEFMRRLVDEPGFATRLGAAAAADVARTNSIALAGDLLGSRLSELSQVIGRMGLPSNNERIVS